MTKLDFLGLKTRDTGIMMITSMSLFTTTLRKRSRKVMSAISNRRKPLASAEHCDLIK